MHLFMLLSTLLLATIRSASADATNYFINPPATGAIHQYSDNKVYSLGSTLQVQWATNYPTISLVLWQNGNSSYQTLIDNQPAANLSWNVDIAGTFDLKQGNIFFFSLYNGSTDSSFGSHYFNLTDTPTTTTTTSAPTTTATASQTSTPSAAAASSGLSTGAKAGIGIGAAIGALALIAAAVLAFFLSRRRKGGNYAQARSSPDMQQPTQYQAYQPAPGSGYSAGGGYAAVPNQAGEGFYPQDKAVPVEMNAPLQTPSELPAHQATHELMAQSPVTGYK